MSHIGDAIVQFPISGSYDPTVYLRMVSQTHSATLTVLTASTTSQLGARANPNRLGFVIVNDSPSPCFVRYGAPADSYLYSAVLPPIDKSTPSSTDWGHEHGGPGVYTGAFHVIWSVATGSLKFTELT